jgi:hypothetical protein
MAAHRLYRDGTCGIGAGGRSLSLVMVEMYRGHMGEAKRQRDAVLSGPCPCGSGKSAHRCCFNGRVWHKPPVVLGLRTLPPAGRVEKCYMKDLGSCIPPISGEHIISNSVSQVLMGDGEFSISGLPWLEAGEVKIIPTPQANCLCTKHNSAISPLDAAADCFFASLKLYLEHPAGSRHMIVSGHDLERWLLKTAKAAAVSRNLARGRERLSGAFSRDAAILDMLDDPRHWPAGAGLYCTMSTGDLTENTPRFQFQPLTNENDDIEAVAINIMGFRFVLLLEAQKLNKYPFLRDARYRPSRILISYPASTNWMTLSWEDGKPHQELTAQWLSRSNQRQNQESAKAR